jgi:chromosome segregation ATPase
MNNTDAKGPQELLADMTDQRDAAMTIIGQLKAERDASRSDLADLKWEFEALKQAVWDANYGENGKEAIAAERDAERTARQEQVAALTASLEAERKARKALQDAADLFAAEQSRAPHPSCGLVQPVSVADCEALNAALALASELP